MSQTSTERDQLNAARRILKHVGEVLDMPLSVRLWDGSSAAKVRWR